MKENCFLRSSSIFLVFTSCIFLINCSTLLAQKQDKFKPYLDKGNEICESNPDSAIFYFNQALALVSKSDSGYLARIYNRKAQAYSMKGEYAISADYSFKALKLASLYKDTIAIIDANNNLGIDQMYQKNYETAIDYFSKVVDLATHSKDSLRLGHAYNNIGLTLGYAGDTKAELENYATASEIFLKIGETEGYANTILNKATAFTYLKDFTNADKLYRQAMAVYEKLGYANAINMTLQSMAENTMEANNPKQALVYAKQALLSSRKNGYKTEEASCLGLISKIFKTMNKWDSAFYYLNKYHILSNEIFNAEKVKISSELDKKYKTELKEQEIVKLQQLNKIQELEATTSRLWQIGLVLFLVLVLVLTSILYSRYQLKMKNEKELNAKNLELERLNIFKDRMFAVISHDLRNPVHAFQLIIQGLTQNIEHVSKEDLKDFLTTTLQSAIDLKSLLNNLLEWALVQIGKLPFKPERVHVNEVLENCIQHLQSIAKSKNIQFENSIGNETVLGDKNMLTIILRNILSNAIKFSFNDTIIKCFLSTTANAIQISIQDFGIGMNEEDVLKLLKPDADVFSIGNSGEKGAGIGLLLSKELALRNNGKIIIESTLGKGSIFTLELPKS